MKSTCLMRAGSIQGPKRGMVHTPISVTCAKPLSTKVKKPTNRCDCGCECGEEVLRSPYHLKRGNCSCKNCKAETDRVNNGTGYKEITGIYWSSVKRQAVRRGVEFTLDIEDAWKLLEHQNHKCVLSGMEIGFARTKHEYLKGGTTASLDRIDSSKGYIKGNVQWTHKWINRMKSNHSQETFIDLCKKVACQNSVRP